MLGTFVYCGLVKCKLLQTPEVNIDNKKTETETTPWLSCTHTSGCVPEGLQVTERRDHEAPLSFLNSSPRNGTCLGDHQQMMNAQRKQGEGTPWDFYGVMKNSGVMPFTSTRNTVIEARQIQKGKFYIFSLYVQLRLKVMGVCTYICPCTGNGCMNLHMSAHRSWNQRGIMGLEEGSLRETEETRG